MTFLTFPHNNGADLPLHYLLHFLDVTVLAFSNRVVVMNRSRKFVFRSLSKLLVKQRFESDDFTPLPPGGFGWW